VLKGFSCFFLLALASGRGVAQAEAAFSDWLLPPAQPLRVQVCRGLWSQEYRIEEALALNGGCVVSESWHVVPGGFGWLGPWDHVGGDLWGFPSAGQEMANHHLFILCHISAQALGHRQALLREFVRNGGAVLFLGGRFAFGQQYHNTPLEEMSPVSFVATGFDLRNPAGGVALEARPEAFGRSLSSLPWAEKPRIYWYHEVAAKDGAQVVLTAAGKPMLTLGQYGKGRVAVFAGTVMGDPAKGEMPFWKWDGWPAVLGQTIRWLSEAPSQAQDEAGESLCRRLEQIAGAEDVDIEAEDDAKKRQETLRDQAATLELVAGLCHSRNIARLFLEAAARFDDDLPPAVPVPASRALRPHADASFAPLARKLVQSGKPHKTALGLRVLGMAGDDQAIEVMERFYGKGWGGQSPAGDTSAGALDLSLPGGQRGDDPVPAIRQAAVAGLANLKSEKALAVLRRIAKERAEAGRYKEPGNPNYFQDVISDENRLYQEAVLGILRAGDASVAGEVIDFWLENLYVYIRARMERNKPEDKLNRIAAAIGPAMDWQQELLEKMATAPDRALPALATRIATEKERRVTAIALALFAGRELQPDVAEALRRSPVAAVRALAGNVGGGGR
jgi:hypothetical protein